MTWRPCQILLMCAPALPVVYALSCLRGDGPATSKPLHILQRISQAEP